MLLPLPPAFGVFIHWGFYNFGSACRCFSCCRFLAQAASAATR
jgi:hypothetical protein